MGAGSKAGSFKAALALCASGAQGLKSVPGLAELARMSRQGGKTLLGHAIDCGNAQAAQILAPLSDLRRRGEDGKTPAEQALCLGSWEAMEVLAPFVVREDFGPIPEFEGREEDWDGLEGLWLHFARCAGSSDRERVLAARALAQGARLDEEYRLALWRVWSLSAQAAVEMDTHSGWTLDGLDWANAALAAAEEKKGLAAAAGLGAREDGARPVKSAL